MKIFFHFINLESFSDCTHAAACPVDIWMVWCLCYHQEQCCTEKETKGGRAEVTCWLIYLVTI